MKAGIVLVLVGCLAGCAHGGWLNPKQGGFVIQTFTTYQPITGENTGTITTNGSSFQFAGDNTGVVYLGGPGAQFRGENDGDVYVSGAGTFVIGSFAALSSATNLGEGSLLLANLTAGQRALITDVANAALVLGAGTASNAQCIVVGDGNVSHGARSVTADSFWASGSGFHGNAGGLTNVLPSNMYWDLVIESNSLVNLSQYGSDIGVLGGADGDTVALVPTNGLTVGSYVLPGWPPNIVHSLEILPGGVTSTHIAAAVHELYVGDDWDGDDDDLIDMGLYDPPTAAGAIEMVSSYPGGPFAPPHYEYRVTNDWLTNAAHELEVPIYGDGGPQWLALTNGALQVEVSGPPWAPVYSLDVKAGGVETGHLSAAVQALYVPQVSAVDDPEAVTPRRIGDELVVHTATQAVYRAFGITTNDWVQVFP